jgi:chemotaxis family two-component system response regulator Rcp1
MNKLQTITILLVEDSVGDIRLTQEAFKESKLKIELHTAMDGVAAMDFLHKTGQFTQAPRPDLILLDLNLPKKNGRQVLQEIKEDPKLMGIPVAVLTMSKAEEDIIQAYKLHANCYINKPLDLNQFVEVVRSIENFWFNIVSLPPKE